MVWGNTTAVGCGRTECTGGKGKVDGWYVVCEYFPAGNVLWKGKGGEGLLFEWNVHRQVVGSEGDVPDTGESGGDGGGRTSDAKRGDGQVVWKVLLLTVMVIAMLLL